MTSHPSDMDQALIDAHRDIPKLMPFMHLPVQSGSQGVPTPTRKDQTAQPFLGDPNGREQKGEAKIVRRT